MLPIHGRIKCRKCFPSDEGDITSPHPEWRMINDPGAWGGGTKTEYLILGFSKGATQVDIYQHGNFEDVAFAGMRARLTQALQAMDVISQTETADEKIMNPNSNMAFGSLIRCSVSRFDKKASKHLGHDVFGCTGPMISKSFAEIPGVINTCTDRFLKRLPESVKVVFLLGNTDSYVKSCQALIKNLFPEEFYQINPMAVIADGRRWVHLAHPSGLNGHFNTWLTSSSGAGMKRIQARDAIS